MLILNKVNRSCPGMSKCCPVFHQRNELNAWRRGRQQVSSPLTTPITRSARSNLLSQKAVESMLVDSFCQGRVSVIVTARLQINMHECSGPIFLPFSVPTITS